MYVLLSFPSPLQFQLHVTAQAGSKHCPPTIIVSPPPGAPVVGSQQLPPNASQYLGDQVEVAAETMFALKLPDYVWVVKPVFTGAAALLAGGVAVGLVHTCALIKPYPARPRKMTVRGTIVVKCFVNFI